MLEMLTMCPPRAAATMFGAKKWQPCTTPRRLMSITQSQSSSDVSRNVPPTATPALLTTTSAAGASAWTAPAKPDICIAIGDVDATDNERAIAELGFERVEPSLIDIARGDPRAALGKGERGGAADAAACSGDDDDAILKVHAASVNGRPCAANQLASEVLVGVVARVKVAANVLPDPVREHAPDHRIALAGEFQLLTHATPRHLFLAKQHHGRPQPVAAQHHGGVREPGDAQRVRRIDQLQHVERDGLVLDLLGGVPREQMLHLRVELVEHPVGERAVGQDRGEVLGRRGAREVQLRRDALLDPARDRLVAPEERIDDEALRAQHVVEPIVGTRVMALLLEERLDLCAAAPDR